MRSGNDVKFAKSAVSLVLTTFSTVCAAEEFPQSTHPVWSPDGTHIAFINNSSGVRNNNPINFEIFTKKVKGGEVKRHTFNTAFEADISWSPDNMHLAFKSYRDGNDEVYVINLKDGKQTNISANTAREGSPFWSKNGDILYFWSDRDNEHGEVYSYDFEQKITDRITNNDIGEGSAVLSPDGKYIAFVSNKDGDDDIYLSDLNGDNVRQLTNNPKSDWYPKWSPNGQKILFTYGDWDTDAWEVREISIDGSVQQTLITGTDSGNASWHPEANKIAYASSAAGPGQIFFLDILTKKICQVVE